MIAEKIISILVVILSLTVLLAIGLPDESLEPEVTMIVEGVPELSGLAWDPRLRHLVAVTDEGQILRMSLDGEILLRAESAGRDLEAASISADGARLLLLDEVGPGLCIADPATLEIAEELRIPSDDPRNLRFEGVLAQGGHVLLAREGGGIFRWSSVDPKRAPELIAATEAPLNDLTASADGEELLLLSRSRGLRLLSATGEPLGPWRRLRLRHAEGLAWVPGRGLYVVTDENPSRLALFARFHSWADLRRVLTAR